LGFFKARGELVRAVGEARAGVAGKDYELNSTTLYQKGFLGRLGGTLRLTGMFEKLGDVDCLGL
jgi:hypothetical protein